MGTFSFGVKTSPPSARLRQSFAMGLLAVFQALWSQGTGVAVTTRDGADSNERKASSISDCPCSTPIPCSTSNAGQIVKMPSMEHS